MSVARPLVLDFQGREIPFALEKVERSDLYGYVEIETFDDRDQPCKLATLTQDGRTLLGPGATATANLTPDGRWVERGALTPVGLDGEPLPTVPSSFSAPVALAERATVEQLLDHVIRSMYLLTCDEGWDDLRSELGDGAIFRFPFSFRGGLTADVGFLLANPGGSVFLLVGSPARLEFVGLAQAAPAADEEDEPGEEEDPLDFSMF